MSMSMSLRATNSTNQVPGQPYGPDYGTHSGLRHSLWSDGGCSLMGICLYGINSSWKMDEWLTAATPFGSARHCSSWATSWYLDTSYQVGPGTVSRVTRINLDSPQSYQLPT